MSAYCACGDILVGAELRSRSPARICARCESLADWDDDADPVLASLLAAPEDDEPLTPADKAAPMRRGIRMMVDEVRERLGALRAEGRAK